jgi:cell wall-associated NlpC family hydrolase
MKWLIGIVTALSLTPITGCVTPSSAAELDAQFVIAENVDASSDLKITAAMLKTNLRGETSTNIPAPARTAKVIAKQILREKNANKVKRAVKALLNSQKKHKTYYVFSGASPSGWDCSGMTMWTYEQIGVELPHRASQQATLGKRVKTPKYGDLVVFKYKGYSSAYHVGIYLSKDKMIHAQKPGTPTRIESIKGVSGNHSDVSYVRVLDN